MRYCTGKYWAAEIVLDGQSEMLGSRVYRITRKRNQLTSPVKRIVTFPGNTSGGLGKTEHAITDDQSFAFSNLSLKHQNPNYQPKRDTYCRSYPTSEVTSCTRNNPCSISSSKHTQFLSTSPIIIIVTMMMMMMMVMMVIFTTLQLNIGCGRKRNEQINNMLCRSVNEDRFKNIDLQSVMLCMYIPIKKGVTFTWQ